MDFIPNDEATAGIEPLPNAPREGYAPASIGQRFESGLWAPDSPARQLWEYQQKLGAEQTGTYYGPGGVVNFTPESNVDVQTARKRYPDVKGIDEPMPDSVLQTMQKDQQDAQARANVLARQRPGAASAILGFGADQAAALLDPVNDAAFMVPVVGEARYASWLARAGEAAGVFGRVGVTGAVGAARGLAGQSLLTGGEYLSGADPDMTLGDAAVQALGGAVGGAIFHTGIEGIRAPFVYRAGMEPFGGDVVAREFAKTNEAAMAEANARIHDAAMRTVAAQTAAWSPVEVRPIFDAERSQAALRQGTALGTSVPFEGGPEAQSRMENAISRAGGAPSQDDLDRAALVQEAKTANLDETERGAMAEAERQIAELRASGRLTAEDEAEIGQYGQRVEQSVSVKHGQETPREEAAASSLPLEQADEGARVQSVSRAAGAESPVLPEMRGGVGEGAPGQEGGRAEPAIAPKPAIAAREISDDAAVTAAGRTVPVKYALVEAGDLVPSQTAEGARNPAYPQELQPRDRTRAISGAQIADIAQKLNPSLLDKMPLASHGAPIIDAHGTVESGNGRTIAIQRAYGSGLPTAEAYKAHLAEQGYPVDGMKEPILVRIRQGDMEPEERQAFVREANQGGTLAMSATERAIADAHSISDTLLDLYRGGDVDSAANRPFVRAFIDAAVDKAEQGAMVGPDGSLSQDAVRRVQGAILAKAYDDASLVSAIIESPDAGIRALGGALTDVSADWAKMRGAALDGTMPAAMDQTPRLLDAVRIVRHARAEGRNVAEYVGQPDMFTGKSVDPETEAYLRLMFRDTKNWMQPVGREKLAEALRFYTVEARILSTEGDLLGETQTTAADILARAKGRQYGTETARPDLFAAPAPRDVARVQQTGAAGERLGIEGATGGGGAEPREPGEQSGAAAGATAGNARRIGTAEVAPPFFSSLTRSVESLKLAKGSADQWRNTIRNLPGVKRDEIEWSGIEDWLKQHKGSVKREAVANYLRENEVGIEEVMKGGRAPDEADVQRAADWIRANNHENLTEPEIENWLSGLRDGTADSIGDLEEYGAPGEITEPLTTEATKFGRYRLPGGENYRELLLTLPERDTITREPTKNPPGWGGGPNENQGFIERGNTGADFRGSHWEEPNVLAHVRFDDRTGPNGEKVLHVAEIQSDWHQKGRREGYADPKAQEKFQAASKIVGDMRPEVDAMVKRNDNLGFDNSGQARGAIATEPHSFEYETPEDKALAVRWHEAQMHARDLAKAEIGGVPNAPFKTSWPELALKRMIRYAAENGYDRISWDTGETNAERYDLSKQVDEVGARKNFDGTFDLNAKTPQGVVTIGTALTREKLTDNIGKDLADKIANQAEDFKTYSGVDLKVGGEGMRGFYDRTLPAIANKLGKKWGAKVEESAVGDERVTKGYEVGRKGKDFAVYRNTGGEPVSLHATEDEAEAAAEKLNQGSNRATTPVHSLPITPAMRESVLHEGQSLFERPRQPFGKRGVQETSRGTRPLRLDDGAVLHLPERPTPAEENLIHGVEQVLKRIVPDAKTYFPRSIELSPDELKEAGNTGASVATGFTHIDGARNLIAVALEQPTKEGVRSRTMREVAGTAWHEALHWLRANGYLKPEEWDAMAQAATRDDWRGQFNIDERYPNAAPWLKEEESIAEGLRHGQTVPDWVPEALRPIFDKVRDVLRQVADHVRRFFGANVTANDVFSRIASGEIAQRGPLGAAAGHIPGFAEEGRVGTAEAQPRTPEEERNAARLRLTAMQDAIKRQAIMDYVEHARTNGLGLAHGITAKMRGISESITGARDSTETDMHVNRERYIGSLVSALDKTPGAMAAWNKRLLTVEWTRELHELNKGKDGKPGISGSKMALAIAHAVHDAQTLAKFEGNRAGAFRGDYDGYIARTSHNPYEIHKAGYEAWRDFTLEHLDRKQTFGDLDEKGIEDFMLGSWHALSTGVHLSSNNGVPGLGGTGNLANRLSQSRVFHWKDADAWRAYQQRFGEKDIELGVSRSLMRAGRDNALMKRWGSNPQYSFEKIIRDVREKYREDHEAISELAKQEPRLREEFRHLTGEASIPKNDLAYSIISAGRAIEDISKLNEVVFAHLSVAATKPFQLRFLGVGRWKSYTSAITNLAQDKSPEGRAIMENLHSNATGRIQSMMHGYEPFADIPGAIARVQMLNMRMGFLPWLLSHEKAGTTWETANYFGQNVGKAFEQLPPKMQRILDIHAISPAEWDVLRNAPDHDKDAGGATFLTPKAADRASGESVNSLALSRIATADPEDIGRIQQDVRDNLAAKLAGLYADTAARSVVTPGIAERAIFTRVGGSYGGPLIGQYKTWAAAAIRQMWGQAIYGMSRGEAVKALAGLFAAMTAMGAARSSIRDALNGEVPDMPNLKAGHDAQLFLKWVVSGGGMGIFGDYVIGSLLNAGQSTKDRAYSGIGALAGPVVEDAAQLLFGIGAGVVEAPFAKDAQHRDKQLAEQANNAMNFTLNHLPVVNTFYIRKFLNWLVLDRLQEMANPGYLQRYQAAVKKRTGQEFYLPPATSYLGAPAQAGAQQ